MFRKLALIVLSVSALACGDDKPAADKSNVGAPCGGEIDCMGAADTCLFSQTLSGFGVSSGGVVHYGQGYCTATCKTHAECGRGGKCPIGEALTHASIPAQYRSVADEVLGSASNCYQPCTTVSDCRTNYQCNTIPAALTGESGSSVAINLVLSAVLEGPISTDKYCLPVAASVPDAGALPDAGGAPDAGKALADASR